MRIYKYFIVGSFFLILFWLYFLYVSPRIHNTNEIEIPQIAGLNISEGLNHLGDLGIKYNIHYIEGDDDTISYTMPKAGMNIYKTYIIDVFAYKKLDSYYNNYIGLIYENYADEIESFCLKHNITYKVEYVIDNTVSSGLIINQNKNENDKVALGDVLIIYVSVSDDYYLLPLFVGRNIYDVLEELNNLGLKCDIIYYSAPIESDIVIYQSLNEGYKIKKGNSYSFELYVSKGIN